MGRTAPSGLLEGFGCASLVSVSPLAAAEAGC